MSDHRAETSASSQVSKSPSLQSTVTNPWFYRAAMVWAAIGSIVLLYLCGQVLTILAVPVGIAVWTAVIVFCLGNVVNRLARYMPRAVAVSLSYVLMIVVFGLVVWLMSSPFFGIGAQFSSIIESTPQLAGEISRWYTDLSGTYPDIMQSPQVAQWLVDIQNSLITWAQQAASSGISGLASVGASAANSFICIGFALVVAYWVLLDAPAMGREAYRICGDAHAAELRFIHETFTRVVGGFIQGTLLQCLIIMVLCMIVFFVLGVPNAMAFALICGILNIIPVVGPWLGGVAAALAALSVGPWSALLSLVFTIAIQQVVYTFVSPKIMSSSVDVHPMIVIMAMMCGSALGAQMSGFMGSITGMLLSIPLAAFAKALIVHVLERRTGRAIAASDGVLFKQEDTPPDAR